jgi:hypothetical protein
VMVRDAEGTGKGQVTGRGGRVRASFNPKKLSLRLGSYCNI